MRNRSYKELMLVLLALSIHLREEQDRKWELYHEGCE